MADKVSDIYGPARAAGQELKARGVEHAPEVSRAELGGLKSSETPSVPKDASGGTARGRDLAQEQGHGRQPAAPQASAVAAYAAPPAKSPDAPIPDGVKKEAAEIARGAGIKEASPATLYGAPPRTPSQPHKSGPEMTR